MASTDYLGYGNLAMAVPIYSTGVTNGDLLAIPIVGRKATLAASALVDIQLTQRQTGIWMVGLAGLEVRSGSASVTFKFSDLAQGGSELGTYTYSITLVSGRDLKAWILPAALTEATWMRVEFTNCAAVGLLGAMPAINPELGIETDMPRTPSALSLVYESPLTGAATAMRRPLIWNVGLNFMAVSDEEWMAFDAMINGTDTFGQVWLIQDLGSTLQDYRMLVGRLVNLAAETHVAPELTRFPFEIRQTL